jgi:hypothetical protein
VFALHAKILVTGKSNKKYGTGTMLNDYQNFVLYCPNPDLWLEPYRYRYPAEKLSYLVPQTRVVDPD